jgi:hypothetical protein
MKKLCIIVLLFVSGLTAFGQEKKMSVGLGVELNKDSRHHFSIAEVDFAVAAGAVLYFSYDFGDYFSTGLITTASYNFYDFVVIEPTLLLRRYFYYNNESGFFAQVDGGLFIIFEDGKTRLMPSAGFRGGYRRLLGTSFYVEPYVRLGYPFAYGIGALAGIRF